MKDLDFKLSSLCRRASDGPSDSLSNQILNTTESSSEVYSKPVQEECKADEVVKDDVVNIEPEW